MMIDKRNINLIQNYFKNQPVLKAFIFGSRARNDAKFSSDLDILVELDYSKPIGLKFVKMQLELQTLLQTKVDLVSSNGISKYIQPFIEPEKMLIYEK